MSFRTCNGAELEGLTANGWTLKDVKEEEHREDGGGYTDYSNGMSVFRSHPSFPVKQLVFILERSRDEEMNLLRETFQKTQDLAKATEGRVVEAEKKLKGMDALTVDLKASEKTVSDYSKNWLDSENLRRRLETDIGKLRKEIGEARFREILGEANKS